MKRALLLPVLAVSLTFGLGASPAQALPNCEGPVDTNCWAGLEICRVYVAAYYNVAHTCVA